ncbi:MAG: hypothetical protein IKD70_06785, partial [Eggerthellaceae bacterium]|nr:hypothetical protein [Eggerthellaceae bacterium]
MKQCPLCGAGCFEDMDTCYCCMYRFTDQPPESQEREEREQPGGGVQEKEEVPAGKGASCERPANRQEVWFAGGGIPDGGEEAEEAVTRATGSASADGGAMACAFGPSIEQVPGVGRCVRIEIPLRAISCVMDA